MIITQAYSQFFPNYGGIEKHISSISMELNKLGHQSNILTTNLINFKPSTLSKKATIEGIHVSRMFAFNIVDTTICPFILNQTGNLNKSDILHIHSLNPDSIFLPLQLKILTKQLPVIITPHFHPKRLLIESLKTRLYFEKIALKLLKKANAIIALTASEKAYYEGLGLSNVYEIPNGVDLNEHRINASTLEAFKKTHDEGRRKILFVGRMVDNKNLELAIRCLPAIIAKNRDIMLYAVGSFSSHAMVLKHLAEKFECNDNIKFFFNPSFRDLPYFYELADITVLPSKYEAFGIVILESWAHKKPIIVSNNGGMGDIVSQGGGIVLDSYKKETWAAAITSLINDSKNSNKIGEEGYQILTKRYLWNSIAKELESIYASLVTSN